MVDIATGHDYEDLFPKMNNIKKKNFHSISPKKPPPSISS